MMRARKGSGLSVSLQTRITKVAWVGGPTSGPFEPSEPPEFTVPIRISPSRSSHEVVRLICPTNVDSLDSVSSFSDSSQYFLVRASILVCLLTRSFHGLMGTRPESRFSASANRNCDSNSSASTAMQRAGVIGRRMMRALRSSRHELAGRTLRALCDFVVMGRRNSVVGLSGVRP
jgi:hypothetical protein